MGPKTIATDQKFEAGQKRREEVFLQAKNDAKTEAKSSTCLFEFCHAKLQDKKGRQPVCQDLSKFLVQ